MARCMARRVHDLERARSGPNPRAVRYLDVDRHRSVAVVAALDQGPPAIDVGRAVRMGEPEGTRPVGDGGEGAGVVGVLMGDQGAPDVAPVVAGRLQLVRQLVDRVRVPDVEQQDPAVGLDRAGVKRRLLAVATEGQLERVDAVRELHTWT